MKIAEAENGCLRRRSRLLRRIFITQGLSMRPGQNKRIRGRNNRKGPNPLTRTYESNGPDVKIRGTAQHVAEKYLQLARDAQSSGDPVVAESYLQHAEHYFRIIAAAQLAQQQAQMGLRNGEEYDDTDEDDDFVALPDRFASPLERQPIAPAFPPQNGGLPGAYGAQPQPYNDRPYDDSNERMDRPQERSQDRPQDRGQDRSQDRGQDRNQNRNQNRNQDRQPRNDRQYGQQGERQPNDRQPNDRQPSPNRNRFRDQQPRFDAPPALNQEQPRVDLDVVTPSLPAFITAPVRVPSAVSAPAYVQPFEPDESVAAAPEANPPAPEFALTPETGDAEGGFHLRPRRRRRPRSEPGAEAAEPTPITETSSAD